MQTHGFTSITKTLANTIQNEGFKGLFRGIYSPIFTIAISRSLNVSVFSIVKPYTSKLSLGLDPTSKSAGFPPILKIMANNFPASFAAGYCAGFVTSLWACPFEFVKLFSQISYLENKSKIGNINALGQIINSSPNLLEGIARLYTGYRFQFLRDTFGAAIYFTSYESFKLALNTLFDSNKSEDQSKSSRFILQNFSNNWLSIVLAGGMSGSLCWISIFPFDTLKSLKQKALISVIVNKEQKTINTLSLRHSLYRGVGASVLRSFFTSMLFFSTYEYLMKIVT